MTLAELVYIDETGYHYADYPSFLDYYKTQYREIYGADTYLEADSQDGQWVAIQAKAAYDLAAIGAATRNGFSPATAQGVSLSSVVKINGIKRRLPTQSVVDLTIVGTVGTEIINGIAQDVINQKWLLPASVIIPISGTIDVTATAEKVGAISAQAATITRIFTPTNGWQTVNNVLPATEGVPVETDFELRQKQSESVAIPSLSVLEGTAGAVASVANVIRIMPYENDSNVTDGDGIPAHSIAIVAEGGDSAEIAEAIALHKTPGTGTYGTTSEVIFDRYGVPNTINFFRPTPVDMKVEVSLTAFTGYTTGYDALIADAVAASINALKIGADVLITKLYVPANLPGTVPGTTFDIIQIRIAKVGDAFGVINVPILFNEAAECLASNVTVVVVP